MSNSKSIEYLYQNIKKIKQGKEDLLNALLNSKIYENVVMTSVGIFTLKQQIDSMNMYLKGVKKPINKRTDEEEKIIHLIHDFIIHNYNNYHKHLQNEDGAIFRIPEYDKDISEAFNYWINIKNSNKRNYAIMIPYDDDLNIYKHNILPNFLDITQIKYGDEIYQNEPVKNGKCPKPFYLSLFVDTTLGDSFTYYKNKDIRFLFKSYNLDDLIEQSLNWFNKNKSLFYEENTDRYIDIRNIEKIYQDSNEVVGFRVCELRHKKIMWKRKVNKNE